LSLQPSAEQRAFERRKDYDLVVIYDSASKAFPAKGANATAPSTLFSIIFEKEFKSSKTLARSPVLLVGGFEAWSDELRKRAQNGAGPANGYTQVSKGPPPALP
jgi:ubiquitin carboxyl-terminal hydrolase 8